MTPLKPTDPETQSPDLIAENVARLKTLFPELLTEGPQGCSVNLDVLKQLVGDQTVTDTEEKYGLNWHGKRQARKLALTPSTGTLRPCPADSVDWDSTQNLMIEGDNLEVLKLLQKSYAGKVKMIYIDPPYNTGNDFVYPDNFKDNIHNYLELTGQVGEGGKLTSNPETSGRFHTDWLNMMYPRLRLAKSLLRKDGLILVSTDEVESDNIKRICSEIFGEENFLERIAWKNKYGAGALTKGFANVHEYILVFQKEQLLDLAAPLDDEQRSAYRLRDEKFEARGGYITQPLATTSKDPRPNLIYPILHNGNEIWPEKQWIWSKERMEIAYKNNEIVINESNGKFSVRQKQYLRDENGKERLGKPLSLMNGPFNQEGTKDIASLFDKKVFNFPKPLSLIKYFTGLVVDNDDSKSGIYLDFFAGSGTMGHAVMAQNLEDGGTRRYILVQLPEPLDLENSDQNIAGTFCDELDKPRNIAELTKERLRRAGTKLRAEWAVKRAEAEAQTPPLPGMEIGDEVTNEPPDFGFRVFKLDSSNIRAWDPATRNLAESLDAHVEHLKTDRAESDILYELLLKLGLDLCVPMQTRELGGKTVHAVGGGVLLACLATRIAADEVESLGMGIAAWREELDPATDSTCIFRDNAFENDVAKTNLSAILQQHGIQNVRSL